MNKMREEFNEWFDSNHKTENESLNFAISEAMFDAWKASRAALCVELPDSCYGDVRLSCVVDALDEAGVSYK